MRFGRGWRFVPLAMRQPWIFSEITASRLRFETYIEELVSVIGHADRNVPLHDYCTGSPLPGERKSSSPSPP